MQQWPWAKTFASRPENPLKNCQKTYGMMCKVNLSMHSCDVYQAKRHYQSVDHLPQDQRYRGHYFRGALRGKDARVLYGERLAAERQVHMNCELPGVDYKRPFYYDVVEGKPFVFTKGEDRVRIQLQLLTIFLKGEGNFRILDELWTQVGIVTGNSASSSEFKWS